MERDPEELRLDDRSLLERLGELLLAEVREPRPECDIGRQRVLSLQRAEPLDRLLDAEPAALQQQLPLEQRTIELAQGQDAFLAQAPDLTGLPKDV